MLLNASIPRVRSVQLGGPVAIVDNAILIKPGTQPPYRPTK